MNILNIFLAHGDVPGCVGVFRRCSPSSNEDEPGKGRLWSQWIATLKQQQVCAYLIAELCNSIDLTVTMFEHRWCVWTVLNIRVKCELSWNAAWQPPILEQFPSDLEGTWGALW